MQMLFALKDPLKNLEVFQRYSKFENRFKKISNPKAEEFSIIM